MSGFNDRILKIENQAQLKALAEPIKAQIVESLISKGELSVRAMADCLGFSAPRLHYHVRRLEELGLIAVSGQRQVGNLVERIYRAAARDFVVDSRLLGQGSGENLETAAAATFAVAEADMQRSIAARAAEKARDPGSPQRWFAATRRVLRMGPDRAKALQERLEAFLAELDAYDEGLAGGSDGSGKADGTDAYALTLGFSPCLYFDESTLQRDADNKEKP